MVSLPVPPSRPPSLRDRIGGRWAVSVPAFLVGAVLIAIGFGLQQLPPFAGPVTPAYRLSGYAVQVAAIGLVMLVADRTVLRRRRERPVSPWLVTGISALLGLARIGALVGLNAATGHSLAPSVTPLSLLLVAVLTAVPLLPVTALLLATREWYTADRERLIAADTAIELERMRATGAVESLRALVDDATHVRLDAALEQARPVLDATRPADDASVRAASDALLAAARGEVRAASHQLAHARPASYPRVRWRAVVRSALSRNPLPAWLAVVAVVVITAGAMVWVMGLANAVMAAVALAVAAACLYPLGRRAITRRPAWAMPVTLATTAITGAIPLAVLHIAGTDDLPIAPQVTFVIAVIVITALISIVLSAIEASDDVIGALGAITEQHEIEARAADEARRALDHEMAGHLHGTVQARLVAAAYDIEGARRNGDDQGVADAIARGREALDSLSPSPGGQQASSWPETREAITLRWSGVLEVAWDAHDARLTADEVATMADLIQECLSNALIHGQASTAAITVRVAPDHISLEVSDDGTGPQRGAAGLGSAVLAHATRGDWVLDGGAHGATVRARVPR